MESWFAMKNEQAKKVLTPLRIVGKTSPKVADSVQDILPYDAVSSLPRILERPEMEHFKLDWNESTIPPSPRVKKAVMSYLDGMHSLNFYPALFSPELRLKLQSYVGYSADHILVTNGSDDALDLICKTYLNPGDHVLTPYPTYTHFLLYARSRGALVDKVVPGDVFASDVEGILGALTEDTKIIYLVNPNNPTGQLLPNAELARIADAAPQAIIIVDEAYMEFAGSTAAGLIADYPNIVVSRSFSKAFGLAAMRIGYLIAQPVTVRELTRLYNPKSVNQLAQVAASAALDDLEYYRRYLEEVDRSKKLFVRWCEKRNIPVQNTPANFIMVKVERVGEVVERLAEVGVYVRNRSGFPQLNGYFRLNLGTVAQTTAVLKRFESVLTELGLL